MKKDYTDIIIVLDRSGSMRSVMHDTIGGFNHFLQGQQEAPGEATITLVQFDDQYESVYRGIAIKDAEPLTPATFIPRGSTALLDAIGRTIEETGARLSSLDESERPEKILFVIVTDGFENASRKYTRDQVNDLISHQRDTYQWEFIFLGANQDAISTASSMGINAANALTYAANQAGTGAAFRSVTSKALSYRAGLTRSASFTSADRDEQKKAGA